MGLEEHWQRGLVSMDRMKVSVASPAEMVADGHHPGGIAEDSETASACLCARNASIPGSRARCALGPCAQQSSEHPPSYNAAAAPLPFAQMESSESQQCCTCSTVAAAPSLTQADMPCTNSVAGIKCQMISGAHNPHFRSTGKSAVALQVRLWQSVMG